MTKRIPVRRRLVGAAIAAFVGLSMAAALARADTKTDAGGLSAIDVSERLLAKIPAGTEIGKSPPRGWTHLVFVATPSIAEGDVNSLPGMAKSLASLLHLTVLANARQENDASDAPWRLEKVAVGFATPIDGKRVVVTSDSASRLGAGFNLIEGLVLSSQERYLAEDKGVVQIVTAPNLVVFDAKSVMLVNQKHRQMVMRHAIVVDAKSGGMGALIWLLDPTSKGMELAEKTMQLLPANFHESRRMHVDGKQISFGIPGPTALAMVRIPQGVAIPFTDELKEVAALSRYTPESARRLESELWKSLSAAGVK